jgi:hypothetical protein
MRTHPRRTSHTSTGSRPLRDVEKERNRLEKVFREFTDVRPDAAIGNGCRDSVKMLEAPNDFSQYSNDPLVATRINPPSLFPSDDHGGHVVHEITESAGAVRLNKAATRVGPPEFLNRRIGLASNQQDVSEMRLIIRPSAIAHTACADGDALDAGTPLSSPW